MVGMSQVVPKQFHVLTVVIGRQTQCFVDDFSPG